MMRLASFGFAVAVMLAILAGLGDFDACRSASRNVSGEVRALARTIRH